MNTTFQVLTAAQVLAELLRQSEELMPGCEISRLNHALQSATRARRDGADDDWIIGALLHDIGGGLAPDNHDRFSAEVVRPFIREEVAWVVEHHGIFQTGGPAERYSWESTAKERYRSHMYFESCAEFCRRWDQASFDADYVVDPLSSFEKIVKQVFNRAAFAPEVIRTGVAVGIPPKSNSISA